MNELEHFLASHPWMYVIAQRLVSVVVILAGVWLGSKLIRMAVSTALAASKSKANDQRGRERDKRLSTVLSLLMTVTRVVLIGAGVLMILREFGFDITPLLTGAGIVGVAVGFGSQSLVKDMISGAFLLIEDQIRIGDVVKINNAYSGTVERLDLRITGVRDAEGVLHVIPNGEIKSVSNMTYEFSKAVVDVPVSYRADLEKFLDVVAAVVSSLSQDAQWSSQMRERPEVSAVTAFDKDFLKITVSVKCEPHSRWKIANEMRRRIKLECDSRSLSFEPTT